MNEFTYELPNSKSFFSAVVTIMKNNPKYSKYYNIIKDGYCEISDSGNFSGKRWDAMYCSVHFYITADTYAEHASDIRGVEDALLKICQMVL